MHPLYKLITLLTGSLLFLTCSNIVELLKLFINSQIIKAELSQSWYVYVITPLLCMSVAFILIAFTENFV